MGSRLKLQPSYGSMIGPDCDNRYGFGFLCVSQHSLRIGLFGSAWFRCLGKGTVESIGNHLYRVCGPAGCTVVMGLSNALYLSRNVPEVEHNHQSHR